MLDDVAEHLNGLRAQAQCFALVASLPRGYDLGWEGLSWDESRKGNAALFIFVIVVVFVYLVLVAQYESFLIPLAVILSLPIGTGSRKKTGQAAAGSSGLWLAYYR